ncbi:MAG: PEGA domain-containing protein [Pseudomonadota bacterium]
MTHRFLNLRGWFFLSMLLCSTAVLADLESEFMDGWIALEQGNYARALKLLRKQAKQGHAQAQFLLGKMYDNGYGVTENDQEARKWYRKSAEQGYAYAQDKLKQMKTSDSEAQEDQLRHMETSDCPGNKLSLTVNAIPSNSRIRIMNIGPKYQPGICLMEGKYEIFVTHQGYESYREWIKITDEDVSLDVMLTR